MTIFLIVLIVLLVLLSAFFSGAETAFVSLNPARLKTMAEEDRRAARASALFEKHDKLLSTLLIGNAIVNILASSLAVLLFAKYMGIPGAVLSIAVMTLVVLIFGEITPKCIAQEIPEQVAMSAARTLSILMYLLKPVTFLFSQWKRLIKKVAHFEKRKGLTEKELLDIVDEAQTKGGIGEHEGDMIRNVIEFSECEASDILTPRVDVFAVEDCATVKEIEQCFNESGRSRLPVYHESIDNITGVIRERDFYTRDRSREFRLAELIKPVIYVTEGLAVSKLLKLLQKTLTHFAVVLDEYGGTVGIVTLQDVLEELVGDIRDEQEESIEEIVSVGPNDYRLLGETRIEKLERELDIEIESESTTVGGWVAELLEHIPAVGDRTSWENIDITVTAADKKHVTELTIHVQEPKDDDSGEDDPEERLLSHI